MSTHHQPFSDLFSKDAFDRIVRSYDPGPDSDTLPYQDALAKELRPLLGVHLAHLASEGRLQPIEGIEGHDIQFATTWNRLARFRGSPTSSPLLEAISVAAALDHHFVFPPMHKAYAEGRFPAGETLQTAYSAFIRTIDAGSPDADEFLMMPLLRCSATGERYALKMNDWRPTLWRHDPMKDDYVRIEPHHVEPIAHLEIDVVSGRMLATDWFDIEGLQEYFDKRIADLESSNDLGLRMKTSVYASEGIVHVCSGNARMSIIRKDGDLSVGTLRNLTNEEGFEEVGDIDNTIWWTTIVDRKRLEAILMRANFWLEDEAIAAVSEYIAENDVLEFELPIGRKHLYACGTPGDFADRFSSPDLDLPEGFEPVLVLSNAPIALEARQTRSPLI